MNAILPIRAGRLKAFNDPAKAYRAGKWCQAILGNVEARQWCAANGVQVRAHSEGINSAGGYFVPMEILEKIISLRETYGAFRSAADVRPMTSDLATVPRRRSGLTTYWVGEGAPITASQAALDGVNLVAQKLAALAIASSELDDDSAIDLGEWFTDEMAYAMATTEDNCGFNGDGSSTYGGIFGICPGLLDASHSAGKVTAASGHDTFAELDAADLTSLMSKLPGYAVPGAKWFISQMGFALCFARIAASVGGFVSQVVNGRNVLSFMGFPVQITPALPQVATDLSGSVMLLFGDLSLAATLGDRHELVVVKSTEHKFAED